MSDKKNPNGSVQINNPIFNQVRDYCEARGMRMGFFFAKAAIHLMNRLDEDADFIKNIQDRPPVEKAAS